MSTITIGSDVISSVLAVKSNMVTKMAANMVVITLRSTVRLQYFNYNDKRGVFSYVFRVNESNGAIFNSLMPYLVMVESNMAIRMAANMAVITIKSTVYFLATSSTLINVV